MIPLPASSKEVGGVVAEVYELYFDVTGDEIVVAKSAEIGGRVGLYADFYGGGID